MLTANDPPPTAYIARPCQYVRNNHCSYKIWTDRRFSDEAVESISTALDKIKLKMGASHVELVGHSGGGAIALLLAARRYDVTSVHALAGNLTPDFTSSHRPLKLWIRSITGIVCGTSPSATWWAHSTRSSWKAWRRHLPLQCLMRNALNCTRSRLRMSRAGRLRGPSIEIDRYPARRPDSSPESALIRRHLRTGKRKLPPSTSISGPEP
ncbi:TPA: hypothetical protein MXR76_002021 [Pseudomonas aeruginosa]|nr:hypothetical protein [Pseudomonas aeruginosa]HBO1619652.1 hypothetical protein [Pseudomonas aeruginosa]HCA5864544.1 hypothetical protein [Pseudomonas aeruginosa]HCA7378144.1 hypothetical protein [Pseudomonas aeruginosa]HCA7773032.1 hypothetical protein [Pseudomonas aeruginosa]